MDEIWEDDDDEVVESCTYYPKYTPVQCDYPLCFTDLKIPDNKILQQNQKQELNELAISAFQTFWSQVEDKVNGVYGYVNNKAFHEIYNFYLKPLDCPTPNLYLPTAMVHMGMNAVDNDTIVSQFISYISSNKDSYFFIFDKDTTATIDKLLASLLTSLLIQSHSSSSDITPNSSFKLRKLSSSNSTSNKSSSLLSSSSSTTISKYIPSVIPRVDDYNSFHLFVKKYYQLNKDDNKRKWIVIIIPFIESVSKSVLLQFMELLTTINKDIPIKLFFGVNTFYHKIINQFSSVSNIQIKKIHLADSISAFEDVFKYLFVQNNIHFIFHYKILNNLIDQFFVSNLSIYTFLNKLKGIIFEHYYNYPLLHSTLLQPTLPPDFKYIIEELESIQNEDITHQNMNKWRSNLFDYLNSRENKLNVYVELLKQSKLSINRQSDIRNIYLDSLDINKLLESSFHTMMINKIKYYNKDEIDGFVRFLKTIDLCDEDKQQLTILENSLNNIPNNNNNSNDNDDNGSIEIKAKRLKSRTKGGRKELILGNLTSSNNQLVDLINGITKHLFPNIYDFPMYESVIIPYSCYVQKLYQIKPRESLISALKTPSYYIACECCKSINDRSYMDDRCILYSIYGESNANINITDWYNIFHDKYINHIPKLSEEELKLRFMRAVYELEYLGFITKNARKEGCYTKNIFDVDAVIRNYESISK